MTKRVAPAWLLEYRRGRFAAFALHSTLALLDKPVFDFIPGAPRHCVGLMRWGERRVPLLDLGVLDQGASGSEADTSPAHALVMAWRSANAGDSTELGAIAAPRRVTMIEVSDAQQCDAANDSGLLSLLAPSWFAHEGTPVAVVDTGKLFSGWLGGARAVAPLV